MDYPEETMTTGAKGKKEARILKRGGKDFIIYGYFDIGSGRMLEKYSILMKLEDNEIEHLFIIQTAGGKELVVKHEIEKGPKKRGVFNEKTGAIVYF